MTPSRVHGHNFKPVNTVFHFVPNQMNNICLLLGTRTHQIMKWHNLVVYHFCLPSRLCVWVRVCVHRPSASILVIERRCEWRMMNPQREEKQRQKKIFSRHSHIYYCTSSSIYRRYTCVVSQVVLAKRLQCATVCMYTLFSRRMDFHKRAHIHFIPSSRVYRIIPDVHILFE